MKAPNTNRRPIVKFDPNLILLVAVKSRVIALNRLTGGIRWSTQLPGSLGDSFVTLIADGQRVFAHTHGQLHCLDCSSGRILWSNELPGCGYGLASLAFPNGLSAPNPALAGTLIVAKESGAVSDSPPAAL